MARHLVSLRPGRIAPYPRAGEPIVPRLLRDLVLDRRDPDLLDGDLGATAWSRLPPETCRRLAMTVVDRTQTRLGGLPRSVLDVGLPEPAVMLGYTIEQRTANTLRRAVQRGDSGGVWTLQRYLSLPRFGGRAVVDLLAAVEVNGGRTVRARDLVSDRRLDAMLERLESRLPVALAKARSEIESVDEARDDLLGPRLGLEEMARLAVRSGRRPPFRVVSLDGTRVVVPPSQVTMSRQAYRLAALAARSWGATTIRAVAAHLEDADGVAADPRFVERLLASLPGFRWIDRRVGWFWLIDRPNALLTDARKIVSLRPRLRTGVLWRALFRSRPGPRPRFRTLGAICREIPGVQVVGGEVVAGRALDLGSCLTAVEMAMVRLVERNGGTVSLERLRADTPIQGSSSGTLLRLARRSPLFVLSRQGRVRLCGSESLP